MPARGSWRVVTKPNASPATWRAHRPQPRFRAQLARRGGDNAVTLVLDRGAAAGRRGYTLEITPRGAEVRARASAGLFYGAVTLWQLATADGAQGTATSQRNASRTLRVCWRGLMLDVARHFRSVDEVKALIDQMALHKLNTLHWHLTDDQGWRIEIRAIRA
jgi:hexosaminidase